MFGEYYSPSSIWVAIAGEAVGTLFIVLMILFLSEGCNLGRPDDTLAPVFIGLSITTAICLVAPLTQAGLNPARDFGPRVVALIFGWGMAAFPDKCGGFFWVYMLAPIVGGQAAALLFIYICKPMMQKTNDSCCCAAAVTVRDKKDTDPQFFEKEAENK